MEKQKNQITLTAASKEQLDHQINETIEDGYLIMGEMQVNEECDEFCQEMCRPKNIDSELTSAAYLQTGFMIVFLVGIAWMMKD